MTKTDFKKEYKSFQEGAKRFDDAMKGIPDRIPVYDPMHSSNTSTSKRGPIWAISEGR